MKEMKNLKPSTKFIIVSQIIIIFFQMISVIFCFFNSDESGVNYCCYFTFICFFLTVIIDILLDYDFTKKKDY